MKTVIVVGSRHGATRGIADALAAELTRNGHPTDVATIADAPPLTDYDAVIVGSSVYFGHWLTEARQYVERNQQALRGRRVWLFSSGPVGQAAPKPDDKPHEIDQLVTLVNARGHRVFFGKLDPAQLGLGERFVIWNVKRITHDEVRDGDFRDWSAIRDWADEISSALTDAVPL